MDHRGENWFMIDDFVQDVDGDLHLRPGAMARASGDVQVEVRVLACYGPAGHPAIGDQPSGAMVIATWPMGFCKDDE